MKLHRYVDHQRLHIVTKDVISLSISVLLLFRHYISHKITFGAPSSGGVLRSACGAFIAFVLSFIKKISQRCFKLQSRPSTSISLFSMFKDFTSAGDWDCVAAVERLPALHCSVDFICPLGSWVSLWNFKTIRGSLMRPK